MVIQATFDSALGVPPYYCALCKALMPKIIEYVYDSDGLDFWQKYSCNWICLECAVQRGLVW